jgi:hypothetical protein
VREGGQGLNALATGKKLQRGVYARHEQL